MHLPLDVHEVFVFDYLYIFYHIVAAVKYIKRQIIPVVSVTAHFGVDSNIIVVTAVEFLTHKLPR